MPTNGRLEAWSVSLDDFPESGSTTDKLRFLARYAMLAPSPHNTQPWRFELHGDALDLYADESRALPIADPQDRELVMSCGAALFNLRAALRSCGYAGEVTELPDPARPALLARVRLGDNYLATGSDRKLAIAMVQRRTNRRRFSKRAIDAGAIAQLQQAVVEEGAWLRSLGPKTRKRAIKLIANADRVHWHNPDYRRELAEWIVPNRSDRTDGVPGYALGINTIASYALPTAIRQLDLGWLLAARDRNLAERAGALAVIGTTGDDRDSWLAAGQAVERVALIAQSEGLTTSFFGDTLEVERFRAAINKLCDTDGFAQQIVGIGHAPTLHPTPRRALDDVIVAQPTAS